MLLASSLLTRYELGAIKVLPVKVHLLLDFLAGAFLCAAPFFLVSGENETMRIAMIVMGILEMGAAIMTQTESSVERSSNVTSGVSRLPRHS
jgi:hypothetical protein